MNDESRQVFLAICPDSDRSVSLCLRKGESLFHRNTPESPRAVLLTWEGESLQLVHGCRATLTARDATGKVVSVDIDSDPLQSQEGSPGASLNQYVAGKIVVGEFYVFFRWSMKDDERDLCLYHSLAM